MENLQIYLLGFLGQAMFGGRLVIQWWESEKKGRVVSLDVYWFLSLAGAYIFLIYGMLRGDFIIIFGQFASYYIYVRNLQLKQAWQKLGRVVQAIIFAAPIATMLIPIIQMRSLGLNFSTVSFSNPIMIAGILGQLGLNLRFVYQWYYSERKKESVLPFGFWLISVWCSVLVIIYSSFHPTYGIEPVLLISQGFGIVVYIRNMMLARRKRDELVQ